MSIAVSHFTEIDSLSLTYSTDENNTVSAPSRGGRYQVKLAGESQAIDVSDMDVLHVASDKPKGFQFKKDANGDTKLEIHNISEIKPTER